MTDIRVTAAPTTQRLPPHAVVPAWARGLLVAASLVAGFATAVASSPVLAQDQTMAGGACANPDALGVGRVIQIDGSKGEVYGGITKAPTHDILRPKEVVLTFDDGPYQGLTRQILDTLDRHCTKATFFVVGQMAVARPDIVRAEIARGHTVGTHTWSHPMPMKALTTEAQIEEIDKGIAAAYRVAGKGLAPFFRFPGLGDSPETLAHLKARGIATFTVDIVSNDSFIADPQKLAERTLNILAGRGKGILLFHDIKPQTAAALPIILAQLKTQGYRVAHLTSKGSHSSRPVVAAVVPRMQRAAVSPIPAPAERERLPWGLAHQGPMPTILPPARGQAATAGPLARPSPTGPSPTGPRSRDGGGWNIFGSGSSL